MSVKKNGRSWAKAKPKLYTLTRWFWPASSMNDTKSDIVKRTVLYCSGPSNGNSIWIGLRIVPSGRMNWKYASIWRAPPPLA